MSENDKQERVIPGDGEEVPVVSGDELQTLKDERDSLYDRLLRKQAEFENYKKRVERERSEFVQFASAELMRELLNALDSFDLALRNASAEQSSREDMLRGFELISKQLQDTLARFGLKQIEAEGQEFDPNVHQAVATKATDEVDENTIIEEMRRGYLLNGRLLRPAMVTVAKKT
jgi:molecular chaperone GrpE